MNRNILLQPRNLLIGAAILIITLFSLLLRIIPVFLGNPDVLSNVGMDDPTYHLRQVEQCIANSLHYTWYDPMTYFPKGQPMHWGPLFTVLSSLVCVLLGATSRTDIISVCLYIPCVMGALLVPVVFLLVKKVADWKAGIIAGFLIAIYPGQIFFRSYYGYFDHHIGEVLFGTLFCLCYVSALVYSRKNPVDISNKQTWKIPAILGITCGISYVIGLSLMPTMLLFALLVGMFTPLWFIIQRYIGHLGASALVINTTTFLVAIIGFFFIGVHAEGGLNYYTIGHPIVYGLLIIGTWILFGFSWYLRDRPFTHYVLAIVGVSVLGLLILAIVSPDLYNYLMANAYSFFGQEIHWKTIQEARQWTFNDAWRTFQYGLVLFGTGIAILLYRIKKELCPSHIFILIWSLVILYATMQHIRYEYYLAIPGAILGGITIGFAIDLLINSRKVKNLGGDSHVSSKGGKHKSTDTSHKNSKKGISFRTGLSSIILVIVIIIGALFTYNSIGRDLSMGAFHLNADWREATTWLESNTPETGVDYFASYDKDTWQLPEKAYGIMSWWDYGHIILYLGKRMPNANPFQYGVDGNYGAARFFITQNESVAAGILDKLKTRYVITDFEMDTGKFWAMTTWDNPDLGAYPYQRTFIIPNPNNPAVGQNFPFFLEPYYKTMVSRLHNFDGSMKEPDIVHFLQVMNPPYSRTSDPLIVNGSQVSYQQGKALLDYFNTTVNSKEYSALLANYIYTNPVSPVPALQHFRLIHESPSRTTPQELPDIRYVKIFEYVPGAVIKGEGIIEIPVMTNTGRTFTYQQESINGTFIVPYPTNAKSGDVTTTGLYRVVSTGKEYEISEDQIQNGATIS